MQKWLKKYWLPAKEGIIPAHQKEKGGGENDTCWQFNANMNSVFRLEIMHQQKYKYNFFHSCVSEKTYVEKLETTIIHYSKFPRPLSESSVGIKMYNAF